MDFPPLNQIVKIFENIHIYNNEIGKSFFGSSLLNGNWQFLIILNQNGLWDFDTSFKRLF